MFGIKKLTLSLNELTEGLRIMSDVTDKLNAEIAKIAAKNFGGNEQLIKDEVEKAVAPVTQRVTDLEKALTDALVAFNNDDDAALETALKSA